VSLLGSMLSDRHLQTCCSSRQKMMTGRRQMKKAARCEGGLLISVSPEKDQRE
jgi:hypothetical protein